MDFIHLNSIRLGKIFVFGDGVQVLERTPQDLGKFELHLSGGIQALECFGLVCPNSTRLGQISSSILGMIFEFWSALDEFESLRSLERFWDLIRIMKFKCWSELFKT